MYKNPHQNDRNQRLDQYEKEKVKKRKSKSKISKVYLLKIKVYA